VAQRGYRAEFAYPRRLWIVPDFKRVRQDDDGVANGLNHYGIDFPGRETTPHPISSVLWRLSNQRNGFDFNRVGAENTIAGDRQGKRDLPQAAASEPPLARGAEGSKQAAGTRLLVATPWNICRVLALRRRPSTRLLRSPFLRGSSHPAATHRRSSTLPPRRRTSDPE
jgi:hypothetical protein